jgi:hypothetical protein
MMLIFCGLFYDVNHYLDFIVSKDGMIVCPLYVFMLWCLIKRNDNIYLTFT